MTLNPARIAFAVVCMAAIAAAAFRVTTAPERAKERRETARSVCTQNGGQWVKVEDAELCRQDGLTRSL